MFLATEKNQKLAVILAIIGAVTPLAGLHKFYLQQPRWGLVYLLLSVTFTPPLLLEGWVLPYFGLAQVASLLEGIWYFIQSEENFQERFNRDTVSSEENQRVNPNLVEETAEALRQLDQLREEGLLSEYEFEQQRRQLVERIRR